MRRLGFRLQQRPPLALGSIIIRRPLPRGVGCLLHFQDHSAVFRGKLTMATLVLAVMPPRLARACGSRRYVGTAGPALE